MLSLFGGLIGIVLGLGLAGAATSALSIPFQPERRRDPRSTAGFLGGDQASAFGFFPALRGARLDLIDALRHE